MEIKFWQSHLLRILQAKKKNAIASTVKIEGHKIRNRLSYTKIMKYKHCYRIPTQDFGKYKIKVAPASDSFEQKQKAIRISHKFSRKSNLHIVSLPQFF